MKQVFFFLDLYSEDDMWSLLKFVIVASDFRYSSAHTMVGHMFLLVLDSIWG